MLTLEAASTAAPLRRSRRRRKSYTSFGGGPTAYIYLVPAVVLVLGVLGFCLGFTVNSSFLIWDGVGPDAKPAGLSNYARLLQDPVILQSVIHLLLMALTIPVAMFLGLIFATLLQSKVFGKPIFKALLFIPVVLSPAIMAPTFRQMFAVDGSFNSLLSFVGLGNLARPWLADTSTALFILALIVIWSSTGFSFLLYFAGLTALDEEMLEAARLDGANNVTIFFRFIVPLTKTTSATLVLLGIIGVTKIFDVPYLITAGGPAHSTEFLSTYLFSQSVVNFNAGYSAAIAVTMIVICIALALGQIRQAQTKDSQNA